MPECKHPETVLEPIKVDKWDGNAIKNALDDAIRQILTDDLGFVEKNFYVDIRLGLSSLGCVVALSALLYDYLYPFPTSKYILIGCVASYFFLMSILTMFMTFVEKDVILQADEKDRAGLDPDNEWTVGTNLQRFDDQFAVNLSVCNGVTGKKSEANYTRSIAQWFTCEGEMLYDKFKADLMMQYKSLQAEKKDN